MLAYINVSTLRISRASNPYIIRELILSVFEIAPHKVDQILDHVSFILFNYTIHRDRSKGRSGNKYRELYHTYYQSRISRASNPYIIRELKDRYRSTDIFSRIKRFYPDR